MRRAANLPATALGLTVAALSGAKGCAGAAGGLIVCSRANNNLGAGGGTTIGDVFVTSDSPDEIDKNLLRHELRHSDQWAGWGIAYPVAYGVASTFSQGTTGTYACGNYFEIDAGLADGRYEC